MTFSRATALVLSFAITLHAADTRLVRETEALTPAEEQSKLHVPEGFEVQLFASEPMINKPINMAFDARGRLWVSSNVEYPYAADKSRWSDAQGTRVKDSRDAIKILEDTDGDGKADKVTDFADGLNIPTGVVPWHKPEHKAGCIAWSIPNIWYFADTDGDDKADLREVLFGPLGYEKDTHGMCSSFRLGLDGWIYATHGFNNTSKIEVRADRWLDDGKMTNERMPNDERSPNAQRSNSGDSSLEPGHSFVIPHSSFDIPGRRIELHSGNVFRFRPDGSKVEKWTSGQVNPFGLCWDRFGNLYSADCHSSPIYQLIRGACYPSFGKPHDGLGFAPVMCEHSHGSTGICGIVYIDGGVWGPEWDDHTFVGNCVTSRVNHDKVTFSGSTPKANEQPDFLTSDDPWFRPVDLQLGPDNALYIADFYNKVIGHYEVPLDHPGRDKERGRIWRVVKKGSSISLQTMKKIVKVNPTDLEDPNLTRRHLVLQTMLEEHPEKHFWLAPPRYHTALMRFNWWKFQIAKKQSKPFMDGYRWSAIFENPSTDVSEQDMIEALRQAEEFGPSFIGTRGIKAAIQHPSARIKLAAAGVMQAHPSIENLPHLIQAYQDAESSDPLLIHAARIAIHSQLLLKGSLQSLTEEQVHAVMSLVFAVPTPEAADFLFKHHQSLDPKILTHIARYGTLALLARSIQLAKSSLHDSIEVLEALHDGLSERGAPADAELLQWAQELAVQLLGTVGKQPEPAWISSGVAETAPKWSLQTRKCADGTEARVLQSMIKGGGDEEKRTGVLKSITFAAPSKLAFWINGHRGPPTAKAHDKSLVRVVDAQSGETFASVFPPRNDVCQRVELDLAKHTNKPVRLEIVDGDDGKAYSWLGITRIEPAVVSVNDFQREDSTRSALKTLAVMLQHTAPAVLREQLAAYLPPRPAPPPLPVSPEQRQQLDALIAARSAALAKAKPDVAAGKTLFKTHCAICHRIGGEGGLIGPQLDGIGARGVERLCEDILDPNRNVDAHFFLHTLTMKDGTATSGFLKAEAGQVLILADAAGQEHRVSKNDLATDETTPMSLMPPVFGQIIPEGDFMHLLGYLLSQTAAK